MPQGTCSGPILFITFSNDLHAADMQFADDNVLWVQADTVEQCVTQMNAKLLEVEQWDGYLPAEL